MPASGPKPDFAMVNPTVTSPPMSRMRLLLLVFSAFLIGGTGGIVATSWACVRLLGRDIHAEALAGTTKTVSLLKFIRSVNSDQAVASLEQDLDSHLLILGLELREKPLSGWDPGHLRILKKAKDYRTQFPRTNALRRTFEAAVEAAPGSVARAEMAKNYAKADAEMQAVLTEMFRLLDAQAPR
jgi:hypothetical protein